MADIMYRSGVPGIAVSVTREDEVAGVQGFGVRDSQGTDPVDEDTVFQLASVSKPCASTVVDGQVSDGIFEWDSRFPEAFPEFEMFDPSVIREVTITDMTSHRSGLPDHAADLVDDMGHNKDEILHRMRFQSPAYSLRSGDAYTNFGFTSVVVAAARAAGMSLEEASRIRLYDQLGLIRTTSSFAEFMSESKRAHGHAEVDGTWRLIHVRNPDPLAPADGVRSSTRDMARWMQLHLGDGTVDCEEIISAAELAES